MNTPSQEFVDRFKAVEYATDSDGRSFGFRRVRISERVKLDEWFPDLRDRSLVLIAASCCEIEGTKITFPKDRRELEYTLDRLEDPGIKAGTEALGKIYGVKQADDDEVRNGDGEGSSAKK